MNIFDYHNYKKFVADRIETMPQKGRGQYRKIAQHLNIGSVNVSQIFKGDRELTMDQAYELCEFFGLTKLESEFFLVLVSLERAGTHKLKQKYKDDLATLREKSLDLKQRLRQDQELSEEEKAVFYSSWFYSAISLSISVGLNTADKIAEYFQLPLKKINQVVEFLLQVGLCRMENDKLKMGKTSTHLAASHPLVIKHHSNWRMKAMNKMDRSDEQDLFLTLPCSLSEKALGEIRKELVDTIERITQKIDEGPEETLASLNIDFFRF